MSCECGPIELLAPLHILSDAGTANESEAFGSCGLCSGLHPTASHLLRNPAVKTLLMPGYHYIYISRINDMQPSLSHMYGWLSNQYVIDQIGEKKSIHPCGYPKTQTVQEHIRAVAGKIGGGLHHTVNNLCFCASRQDSQLLPQFIPFRQRQLFHNVHRFI